LKELAIVIPFYKKAFFEQTLKSLANQTNKHFNVYIGDDNSPENIDDLIEAYSKDLSINYTRFNENIGAKDLVLQWKRCVGLIGSEEWIWLFSDDDLADPDCVRAFYDIVRNMEVKCDAYRFNTRMIDEKGQRIAESQESPLLEASELMAYELLMGRRGNSIVDHIFSRRAYELLGGFVRTDYAQGADWATSILFSKARGLCTIPGPRVSWRLSNQNISGNASRNAKKKINGHLQFLRWVQNHFIDREHVNGPLDCRIKDACDFNLDWVLREHYKRLPLSAFLLVLEYYWFSQKNLGVALKKTGQLYGRHILYKRYQRAKGHLKLISKKIIFGRE
jgi:glycosyltransferase involved in cell wall biosynthesis